MTNTEKAKEIISIIYIDFDDEDGCFDPDDYNALVSSLEEYIDKIESGEIKSCLLVEKQEILIEMIKVYLTGKPLISSELEEHLLDKIISQKKLISELEKKVEKQKKVLKAIINCIKLLDD